MCRKAVTVIVALALVLQVYISVYTIDEESPYGHEFSASVLLVSPDQRGSFRAADVAEKERSSCALESSPRLIADDELAFPEPQDAFESSNSTLAFVATVWHAGELRSWRTVLGPVVAGDTFRSLLFLRTSSLRI
jgi:hypothetical protein